MRPSARMRQSFSLPASTNDPSPTTPDSRIASSSSAYGRRCASVRGRDEVVGAVEVDRVDLARRDELLDLDRPRRVVLSSASSSASSTGTNWPFATSQPAHDLVGRDLDVVDRAPALLLDRRQALAVQQLELDVRLARRRRRRRREPDGDVDEAEADRSVPGCAHVQEKSRGMAGFALAARPPACGAAARRAGRGSRRAPT